MAASEQAESDHETLAVCWTNTWRDFNRALISPEPFSGFRWTSMLIFAAHVHLYYKTGLYRLRLHIIWRSLVPIFSVLLICLILLSYFASLRSLVEQRWCDQHFCKSIYVHDISVVYLGVMIIFNYLSSTFRSPGVALKFNEIEDKPQERRWKAIDGQGGCYAFDPLLDVSAERKRVELFKSTSWSKAGENSDDCFPSTNPTTCETCNITRPARCHHCAICQRCILHFDHHCIWLNNCVGYHNYRTFVLTLFYLMLGCWYGSTVLFRPFFDPWAAKVAEHGFRFLYSNKTGFLVIQPPGTLLYQVFTQGLEPALVVNIVYPFLFFVAVIETVFFGCHFRYILAARTTLENKIVVEREYNAFLEQKEIPSRRNPFDQGPWSNFCRVLGPRLWLAFLPVSVNPLPPFVYEIPEKKKR
jgi:hypothetical protein